jgi:outer membrane protein OmpA-like peptidoglycan-associated protein
MSVRMNVRQATSATRRAAVTAALAAAAMVGVAHAQQKAAPYFEVGVDPFAVVTRPVGSLTSIRSSAPCRETYDGTTRVNPGVLGFVGWVIDGSAQGIGSFEVRGLRLAAGFDDISSDWSSDVESYGAYDRASGAYTSIRTQFMTGFVLRYLRAALELEASAGGDITLRVGPSVSVPLTATSRQREIILSPSGASFIDGTQERLVADGTGTIGDAGVRVGASIALAYRLPLGRRAFFEPTAGIDLGITTVQPDWTPLELRLGISMGYALFADEEPPPDVVVQEPTPPVTPPAAPFAGTVDIRLADDRPIALRRQIIARYTPVIPVVFFDLDRDSIAARYHALAPEDAAGFAETSISTAADTAHLDVLNIIGARLRAKPSVKVALTGTTSDDENDRDALARRRADAVAGYLERVWGIDPSRLAVRSRRAPLVASNGATPEGRAENRRVEIGVSDESVLAPVQQRTVEPVSEPRSIAFATSLAVNRGIASWGLVFPPETAPEMAAPEEPPATITWKLDQSDRERILSGDLRTYELRVTGIDGGVVTSPERELPLRLDTTVTVATSSSRPDNAAEFLLITFDFDQARLTERGRHELETIVRRIGPESAVAVTGYTDRIGEIEHNRALAKDRAESIAALLPKAASLEVRGADQSEAPYSNGTPEGRFLSRTVRVVITNPR